MERVKTYNSKQVTVSVGTHAISGFADDSFITVEPVGEGIMSKSGCDGEVARAIDPNSQYTVKLTLLQTSRSNNYLHQRHVKDKADGDGMFPILIKDLRGNFLFSADSAWVTKDPSRQYGKDTNNREWEIVTGPATIDEGEY